MIKRLLPIILFAISLLTPTVVYAQENISVLDSSTENHFPSALVFKLKVESPSDITEIRLNYQVEKMNFAKVISEAWPEFTPSPSVETQWIWDMRNSSLPPSAVVHYWWIIENKSGSKLITPVTTIRFTDNRYSWQSLSSGKLTLYYYESNQSVAQELLTTALQAIDRLAADTGVHLEDPVDLYIYANSKDLQGSMIFPREWTGGVAFTQYSIITIGISSQNLDWGKNALAHELGHMVTHQITFSPYGANLPTWLDEGLAMHAEGQLDANLQSYLKKAIANQKLISIRSLSSPFSAISEEAYLSYAESQSIVEFLIQNYGKDKMSSMLNLLKEGHSIDEALTDVYGVDQDGLDQLWRKSLTAPVEQIAPSESVLLHPSFIFSLVAICNPAFAYIEIGNII
jgi:hypothetical protein